MSRLLLLWLLPIMLFAAHPAAFESMGAQLEAELAQLRQLQPAPPFDPEAVEQVAQQMQACFEKGFQLDALRHDGDAAALRGAYLTCLRALEKQSRAWQRRYAKAITEAVERQDGPRFEVLAAHPLAVLERPSLQDRTMSFYEQYRQTRKIAALETLRDDLSIETRSPLFLSTEQSAYKAAQKVLSAQEAGADRRPVKVYTKRQRGGFVFYAQNANIYPVTIRLELTERHNLGASTSLPVDVELMPHAAKKILTLLPEDRHQSSSFRSRYSWVMGLLSARHSDPLYRLPFAAGSRAKVSQGFNGGVTHKGLTRYAVDFDCPMGTKIYAARGGRVVAAESGHNKGGFDKRFGSEANYIIIEHDDHTFGKYYHLKQYGVMVRVGTSVRRGDFIGYSGNTGYSSGPHLHFSVSGVDPQSRALPVTLLFRFYAAEGEVSAPKTGDVYTVRRVR